MFEFLTALAVGGILVFFILFKPKGLVFSLALTIIVIQRRFFKLDSGCNGVVFIQMRKRDGDPGPNSIVQHMMTSAASTRKHMSRFIHCFSVKLYKSKWTEEMSNWCWQDNLFIVLYRFILRMLPIEVACYTSEEEISRAIKPLVAQYFPVDTQNPQKVVLLINVAIPYLTFADKQSLSDNFPIKYLFEIYARELTKILKYIFFMNSVLLPKCKPK
jgi:hypothetical protein